MVLNRSPWKPEEDLRLRNYIEAHGEGGWTTLAKKTGLLRSGKSCRLRWMNYLRPDLKHGNFLPDEEDLILRLHRLLGNRWSLIAGRVPGRTDNDIKNYWNTHLSKKLVVQGEDPPTHKPLSESRGMMSLTPGNRERSQMSKRENSCKKSEDIVDSRADLQHRAISDRVPPSSDPCPITPAAALGNFNTDIFPLLMELYVDEGLRFQEPGKDISVGHSVELWPLTELEAANLTNDLWSNPTPSSHSHPFPWQ